jgi:hypothetical protein
MIRVYYGSRRRPTGAAAPSVKALAITGRGPLSTEALGAHGAPSLEHLAAIDLVGPARYEDWPAEDQLPRQTCVAFAATACFELLRAAGGDDFVRLSPQFLYWYMRTTTWPDPLPPGWNEGATKLGYAKSVLANRGICSLRACPYPRELKLPRAPEPGHAAEPDPPLEGPEPSQAAKAEAARNLIVNAFYIDHPHGPPPGTARKIYDLLAQGRPVAVSLPLFYLDATKTSDTLNNPVSIGSGQLLDPPADCAIIDDPGQTPGHAACVIGFQPDDREAMGGWFILRHSFGTGWANSIDPEKPYPPNVPARGYGAISASYIEHYCWEVMSPEV